MRTLFVLEEDFYSAQEKATVVLTKHFDLLCNDDYFASGRAIITTLGGWQVLLEDMS